MIHRMTCEMRPAYAGIGSQSTPEPVLDLMTRLARRLCARGYVLRSGGAKGADTAFEAGSTVGASEIYLPWPRFRGHASELCHPKDAAFELAQKFHPAWHRCSIAARKLHARNVYQVLGPDLDSPSVFVLCWTVDGQATGGTGQAMRIAKAYDIEIFNLFHAGTVDRLADVVRSRG